MSADSHLVKDVTTGQTWATLRCDYDRSLHDRLLAALKALHVRRGDAARCGVRNAQLVITKDHTGQYRIGLRFIADGAGRPLQATESSPCPGPGPDHAVEAREDGHTFRNRVAAGSTPADGSTDFFAAPTGVMTGAGLFMGW